MPFDELDVSTVAMDAGWDPGPLPCLWVGWNLALGFGVEAATRILACPPRTLGQSMVFIMLVPESWSNLGLGRTWKIKTAILENSVG